MEAKMFGLTAQDVRRIAFQLAEKLQIKHNFNIEDKMAGSDWLRNFMKRHPQLSFRKPEPTSAERATGFNKIEVNKFYDLLQETILQNNLTAKTIFNVDEFATGVVPKCVSRIIAPKGKHQVACRKSAERGQLVTAEICFSADGKYLPPMLIFPRQRDKENYLAGKPEGAWAMFNKNGWIDTEIFTEWFKWFITQTNCSKESPVLIILDGHVSHTKNIDVINLAEENGVILLCLPPHTTHRLQPLDVAFMKPLRSYYAKEVQKWLRMHPGKVVTMSDVFSIFGKAFKQAATIATAKNGFEKTGIWPFNRDLFSDTDFAAVLNEDDGSSFSNIGDEERRSFRRLIEEAQFEIDSGQTSEIVQTAAEKTHVEDLQTYHEFQVIQFEDTSEAFTAEKQRESHEQTAHRETIEESERDVLHRLRDLEAYNDSENAQFDDLDKFLSQSEFVETSNTEFDLVDFVQKPTNCVELDLPHVRVLSSVDTNVQQKLNKNNKPVSKQKGRKRGFTAIITSPEYKETLLQSKLLKSKPKRQPKKQKTENNQSQALASAQNEVRVQVPIQLFQCIQPIPVQMYPGMQDSSALLPRQPLQMFPSPCNEVQSITGTQMISSTMVHPVPMQVQDRRPAEMFNPWEMQMQPSTSTGIISPATIRPVHRPVVPDKPSQLVAPEIIRPVHDSQALMHTGVSIRSVPMQVHHQRPAEIFNPWKIQIQPRKSTEIISSATIRPVQRPILPGKPSQLVAPAIIRPVHDSPAIVHTGVNIRPVPMQVHHQRPVKMFPTRGMQMQPNTSTQLICPATIRPVHKHL